MPPPPLTDLSRLDFDKPMFGIEEVREINPQRFEMEQLTAVVDVDPEKHIIVGFKDVTDSEFWVRGHMPGFPLMPGVLQCECAAQLAGFYARKYKILDADYIGFGGMDNVRFRRPVYPNSRLVIVIHATAVRAKRRAEFDFQGFVDGKIVFNGSMIGVSINREPADGES